MTNLAMQTEWRVSWHHEYCEPVPDLELGEALRHRGPGEEHMTDDLIERLESLATAHDSMGHTCSGKTIRAAIERLQGAEASLRETKKGLDAVRSLINVSSGVIGLHQNDDSAPWDTLEEHGYFESWLIDFNKAEALAADYFKGRPPPDDNGQERVTCPSCFGRGRMLKP